MDGILLSRRQLLAGGLAVGLTASTGCLGRRSDTADGETGPELKLSLRRVDGPLLYKYVHDRENIDPRWDEQALEAATNDEQYTNEYRKPFFARPDDPADFHQEGTYYQLRSVIVEGVTATLPVLRLFEAEDTTATPVNGSREGTLPEADRRAVYRGHLAQHGPNYVSYRGKTYDVWVTQEQFHEPIYRPTGEPIATAPERMESISESGSSVGG